jgi:undecaprenyl-diphosphatase
MEFILFFKLVFLGIIEGLTEFLPISSTGHLIVFADIVGFNDKIAALFEIVIQLGAILAVVWLYRKKIFSLISNIFSDVKSFNFSVNLFIAFLPASIVGFLFHDIIKGFLFNPVTVSVALVVGGVAILFIESRKIEEKTKEALEINKKSALIVGLSQILSLIREFQERCDNNGWSLFRFIKKSRRRVFFFSCHSIMFAAFFMIYIKMPICLI